MDVDLLYVTFPDRTSALDLAHQMIQMGLAACMNLHPIDSLYSWQGKMVEGKEYVAIFKTDRAHLAELRKAIEKGHPYEVPCLLSWRADANASYWNWITGCLAGVNLNPPADEPEAKP